MNATEPGNSYNTHQAHCIWKEKEEKWKFSIIPCVINQISVPTQHLCYEFTLDVLYIVFRFDFLFHAARAPRFFFNRLKFIASNAKIDIELQEKKTETHRTTKLFRA